MSSSSSSSSLPPHYADNPAAFPMEGGCSCGHTRYRLAAAPLVVHSCHCTSCQRETGAALAINVVIEAAHLTQLPRARAAALPSRPDAPDTFPPATGTDMLVAADDDDDDDDTTTAPPLVRVRIPQESGEAQTVTRCARCLTAVWAEYGGLGPAVKFVRGGTLDRAWLVQPDVHLFVRSRRAFVAVADATPRFDGSYDRSEVWRAESLERWETVVRPEVARYRESLARDKSA